MLLSLTTDIGRIYTRDKLSVCLRRLHCLLLQIWGRIIRLWYKLSHWCTEPIISKWSPEVNIDASTFTFRLPAGIYYHVIEETLFFFATSAQQIYVEFYLCVLGYTWTQSQIQQHLVESKRQNRQYYISKLFSFSQYDQEISSSSSNFPATCPFNSNQYEFLG